MDETPAPVAQLVPGLRALIAAREVDTALRLLEAAVALLERELQPSTGYLLTAVLTTSSPWRPGAPSAACPPRIGPS